MKIVRLLWVVVAVYVWYVWQRIIPKDIATAIDSRMSPQYNAVKWCVINWQVIAASTVMILLLILAVNMFISLFTNQSKEQ